MNRLLSIRVWSEIASEARDVTPKRAAIAYVSSESQLAFRQGDVLVTDATDGAISGGLTNATVLERALQAGARLFSCPNLHAKVVVLKDKYIVGSANCSKSSAETLIEAAVLGSDQQVLSSLNKFLDGIEKTSTRIDQGFIDRIKRIPVVPRRTRGGSVHPSGAAPASAPVFCFYKQALVGDAKKYRRRSNKADTGGGARDLRVSPASHYQPLLQRFFSDPGPQLFVYQGRVYWKSKTGDLGSAMVELWPPTNSRSRELRLANFADVKAWKLTEATIRRRSKRGGCFFYLLEMDDEGVIWARVISDLQLNQEPQLLRDHIKSQLGLKNRGRRSINGVVDFSSGKVFPSGSAFTRSKRKRRA